jgi:hypothetical protein
MLSFILFTSLWILFFKTQIKHPDSYKPYVISFLFSVLLELQSKLSGAIHNNRKEDALVVQIQQEQL